MNFAQISILLVLAMSLILFIWGRWRHDLVALTALLVAVMLGVVSAEHAFSGFGHPAVVTVACVLILSRGLQRSGAIEWLLHKIMPAQRGPLVSFSLILGMGALLSGFMNNIGAMALLMPLAMQQAKQLHLSPGQVLMPLAFTTMLGGMTTLMGTPPNMIVSGFRAEVERSQFQVFDFTPIGVSLSIVGIALMVFGGWRLVPVRQQSGLDSFESGAYISEATVPADSRLIGLTLREAEALLDEQDGQILGIIQRGVRLTAANPLRTIYAGDLLVIEAEVDGLVRLLTKLELQLTSHNKTAESAKIAAAKQAGLMVRLKESTSNDSGFAEPTDAEESRVPALIDLLEPELCLQEMAVLPTSSLIGRSAKSLLMRTRYGVNLLALSRAGHRSVTRLREIAIRPGDLILLQGPADAVAEFAADHGCVPLATRDVSIPDLRKAMQSALLLLGAVLLAATGLLPTSVAFALGALGAVLLHTVPARLMYSAIDGPVIVLLACLMPLAEALESSGTADILVRFVLTDLVQGDAVLALGIVLVLTMMLSDLMNNAATAAVMCPIAHSTALTLGVATDPFLMAVAIGASCAFLTPIGHQNNTLILGPGGFKFGDYWRLGLPLELLVIGVSLPMLLWLFPL